MIICIYKLELELCLLIGIPLVLMFATLREIGFVSLGALWLGSYISGYHLAAFYFSIPMLIILAICIFNNLTGRPDLLTGD